MRCGLVVDNWCWCWLWLLCVALGLALVLVGGRGTDAACTGLSAVARELFRMLRMEGLKRVETLIQPALCRAGSCAL